MQTLLGFWCCLKQNSCASISPPIGNSTSNSWLLQRQTFPLPLPWFLWYIVSSWPLCHSFPPFLRSPVGRRQIGQWALGRSRTWRWSCTDCPAWPPTRCEGHQWPCPQPHHSVVEWHGESTCGSSLCNSFFAASLTQFLRFDTHLILWFHLLLRIWK